MSSSTPRGSLLARVVTPVAHCIEELGSGGGGTGRPQGLVRPAITGIRPVAAPRAHAGGALPLGPAAEHRAAVGPLTSPPPALPPPPGAGSAGSPGAEPAVPTRVVDAGPRGPVSSDVSRATDEPIPRRGIALDRPPVTPD